MSAKLSKKRINFIEAAGRKEVKKDSSKTGKIILFAIPIVMLVGVLGLNLFFFVLTRQTENASDKIEKAMNDPAIAKTVEQIDEYHAKIDQYESYKKQLDAMMELLASDGQPGFDLVQTFMDATGGQVTIKDMTYAKESGVTLSVQTADNKEAALFVQRLRSTNKFADISYSGFTEDKDLFTFTVGIVLQEEIQSTKEGAES